MEVLKTEVERRNCGGSVVIPSGTTTQLKPLDVSVNISCKDYSRNKYEVLLQAEEPSTSTAE
jgi:hypothetical protein